MRSGKVREQPWYYHSFDDHNDQAWRNYWMSGDDDYDREFGYGGFTLFFDPVARVVGISLCGLKDRFEKRLGRAAAEEITRGFKSEYDDWYILCPTMETTSPWVTLMLKVARYTALDYLTVDYPESAISVYTPEFRRMEAINRRNEAKAELARKRAIPEEAPREFGEPEFGGKDYKYECPPGDAPLVRFDK